MPRTKMSEEERKARKAEAMRKRRAADPERDREISRKYYDANREKVNARSMERYYKNKDAIRDRRRELRQANPEKHRAEKRKWVRENYSRHHDNILRREYGITRRCYENMVDRQGGRCACCGCDEPGRGRSVWSVDHCHDTGRIRGLLCGSCNTAIGHLGDNADGVRRALVYLERSGR